MNEPATATTETTLASPGYGWSLAILPALAAGLVDLFAVGPTSIVHASLVAALVAGAGLATWRITEHWGLAGVTAATAALWSFPYLVPASQLWISTLPLLVLLVPAQRLDVVRSGPLAVLVALIAAALALVLGLGALPSTLAGASAFILTILRPDVPTEATLRGLRAVALLAPGVVLIALVGVNAGTGWFEQAGGADALGLGVGLLGVLALASLALLGLATLLASTDPAQRTAWLASALGLALLVAVVPARDVALLQAAGAHAVAPLAVLAVIAGARVAAAQGRAALGGALPLVASALQLGLL